MSPSDPLRSLQSRSPPSPRSHRVDSLLDSALVVMRLSIRRSAFPTAAAKSGCNSSRTPLPSSAHCLRATQQRGLHARHRVAALHLMAPPRPRARLSACRFTLPVITQRVFASRRRRVTAGSRPSQPLRQESRVCAKRSGAAVARRGALAPLRSRSSGATTCSRRRRSAPVLTPGLRSSGRRVLTR